VTPFDSLHIVSYYRPIYDILVENRRKTHLTLIWHVPLGLPLANFSTTHILPSLESWGYQMVYILRSCFRSATIPACDGQTDGPTDRYVAVAKTALA